MGANKLEAFTIEEIKRGEVRGADYNPRQISESARKKLRKFLRENGLWCPLVMNKRTGNLVSGHQRLEIMDALMRTSDYRLTMSIVDVDEKTEISGNVFMNNPSAQGEWDIFLLKDLKEMFPDIDYESDFGFDISEIEVMFGDIQKEIETGVADGFTPDPVRETRTAAKEELTAEDYRALKAASRAKAKAENAENGSYNLDEADYAVTIVFPNNHEKHSFMRKIHKPEKEKYLKSTALMDIYNHVYDLSILGGQ
jgi:hypothetical protein